MEPTPCPGCQQRDARLAALEARNALLEARIAELEGRLRDLTPPTPLRPVRAASPPPAKKPTGKRPGGQPGHPPHLKELAPAERVCETVIFTPRVCTHCRTPLTAEASPDDPPPVRHQVAELPDVTAQITEYQGQARTCPCCGKISRAVIPDELRAHSVGPKLTAVLSYLVGCHGVSKRGVEEMAEAVFDVRIALGTVANLEQEVSAALAPAHQEAIRAIQQAPVKHVDETGWKQAGRKRWLWIAATGGVAVFVIQAWRNVTALRRLLGEKLIGILCSDRWCAYDDVPVCQRQVCWAHLKRNWEKMAERGGAARRIAQACLRVQRRVFEAWHLFRGGGCSRDGLCQHMLPLILELLEVLHRGKRCRDRRTRRFCARLLTVYAAMWTFVVEEGVDPTNNHAERLQRRAVLWRRRSFGCHSASGCRFVERILTVVLTLRLQGRSVVPFLHQAIAAHRAGTPTPQLLVEG